MKKLSIALISSFIYATNITYILHDKHAFTLKEDKSILSIEYQKVNDTIDVFNVKKSELKSNSFSSIGDLDGYKINFYYGLSNDSMILTHLKRQDIEYGSGKLINYNANFSYKNKFYEDENKALSVDFGMIFNKGNNLKFKNKNYLSTLAKRFFDVKDVKITNNSIGVIKKDNSTEILNLKEAPYIKIFNLNDSSLFLSLNAEKIFNNFYLDFFVSGKYTHINTKIKAHIIPKDEASKEKISKYKLTKNLNRDESSIDIGFNTTFINKIFITEFSYAYRRLFRSKDLDYVNYNHIINLDFTFPISNKTALFIGGKLMYRQFNGEIPYLYNKYSQTTFDHKYGYARIGAIFRF